MYGGCEAVGDEPVSRTATNVRLQGKVSQEQGQNKPDKHSKRRSCEAQRKVNAKGLLALVQRVVSLLRSRV